MTDIVADTLARLAEARERSEACLVSYSGGKDSMVVMDLALRTFSRVEAIYMYVVPGLEQVEVAMEECRQRWGVKVNQYPHFVGARCMATGVYCDPAVRRMRLPPWTLTEIYELAMIETKTEMVLTGSKMSDNPWRRRRMARKTKLQDAMVYPIASWLKLDVLNYLKRRNIKVPESDGRTATGVDLSVEFLLWCHKTWPNDFRRICEFFPYAEVVVWYEKFFPEMSGVRA